MNTSIIIDPARISSWRSATWAEYLERIENLDEQERIFFNLDTIWIMRMVTLLYGFPPRFKIYLSKQSRGNL